MVNKGYHYVRYAVLCAYVFLLGRTIDWLALGVRQPVVGVLGTAVTVLFVIIDIRNHHLWRENEAENKVARAIQFDDEAKNKATYAKLFPEKPKKEQHIPPPGLRVSGVLWTFYTLCLLWFMTMLIPALNIPVRQGPATTVRTTLAKPVHP